MFWGGGGRYCVWGRSFSITPPPPPVDKTLVNHIDLSAIWKIIALGIG